MSITGSIIGASRNDPLFKSWLRNTDLDNDLGINNNYDNNNNKINFIEYLPLADRIVRILEILLENNEGINLSNTDVDSNEIDVSNLNWILKEFELIDLLINQVRKIFLFFLHLKLSLSQKKIKYFIFIFTFFFFIFIILMFVLLKILQ